MDLFTFANLLTLGLLTMLQAVLGFDNLLYISLESKNVAPQRQKFVRQIGIGGAIVLRIVLLFVLMKMISYFQNPIFDVHVEGILGGEFNIHALIVLAGGAFIIYTATKEIFHMMNLEEVHEEEKKKKSERSVIISIVVMNLVFSFDSILSAMALTDIFEVMATAIIIGGILMIWLSDRVSNFLQRNRMYEVLGLFILFVVGIMLVTEGAHLAHLHIGGEPIMPMTKTTFYFVLGVLVLTDVVQGRYQKKIQAEKMKHSSVIS